LISKDVGREVLDVILAADKQIDDTISGVTDLLMRFRKRLDANQIALSRFVITKKLTKAPKKNKYGIRELCPLR
jgi:DNA polymerase elongation subunit (family B)